MNALFWVMGRVDGRLVLNIDEVADTLGLAVQTVDNQIDDGSFPIPLRKQGRRWLADARDVAEHLDLMRAQAREAHDLAQSRRNASPYAAMGRRKKGDPPSPSPDLDHEMLPRTSVKSFEEIVRELGERWVRSQNSPSAETPPIEDSKDDPTNAAPSIFPSPEKRRSASLAKSGN
ncbi:helix-turn-helix domain-containing protein [Caballeronia sp. LjRoot29]|uniref:helix-turn-helix transcriptional regulator n=1 Tax=Caballeronia sp. LjRoot29 TaxID=3342315 RepID=UPI003ECD1953